MAEQHPRLIREEKTIRAMISLYCREKHNTAQGLCPECQALADYAQLRLQKCPYQQMKTACAQCPTHCYKVDMRAYVREVMRFAGPRMLLRHPVLALAHLLDGLRKPVDLKTAKSKLNASKN